MRSSTELPLMLEVELVSDLILCIVFLCRMIESCYMCRRYCLHTTSMGMTFPFKKQDSLPKIKYDLKYFVLKFQAVREWSCCTWGLTTSGKLHCSHATRKGSHLEAAALLVDLCFYYENSRNDFLHIIQIREVEHDLFFEIQIL